VLARAQGGSIKIARVSEASAEKQLQDVLSPLVQQSGIALQSISATCVGLSGHRDFQRGRLGAERVVVPRQRTHRTLR